MIHRSDHLQKLPATYLIDPTFVQENLNYREMVALSGLFRRWALYDPDVTPERATELIKWSSDFERLAQWLGPDWHPERSEDQAGRMLVHQVAGSSRDRELTTHSAGSVLEKSLAQSLQTESNSE
jgi:hypothetical protein